METKQIMFHSANTNKMEHHNNWRVPIFTGILGGMGKYLVIDGSYWTTLIQAPTFPTRFAEAIVTAFFCGLAGALGKYIFDLFKRKIFKTK